MRMNEPKDGEQETAVGGEGDSPSGEADEVPSGDSSEGASSETERLQSELDATKDRYLRLAAEFDNYRRRSVAQMGESEVRAQARLIGTLLGALDDLGRVTALDPESATVESVLEGVALVERKTFQLLRDAGLEEVDPAGDAFDPNVMEALTRVSADSPEEDDIVDQVFQRGFRFRGQLVRPARVSVRKFE